MNQPKRLNKYIPLGIVMIILTLAAGCTAKYGTLKRDLQVLQAFESNQVSAGYKYYYYGYSNEPIVIFGIDPKFVVKSNMWREVAPDTAKFKKMIRFIWEDYGYYKFGADILDPVGVKVGIIYTAVSETTVKFVGENEIVVIPNKPYLWGPGGRGGGIRLP
jgi:hypothetical protein